MSITNLQQNIPVRQYPIYTVEMPKFDPDKFAEWLTDAYEQSTFKSFSALADKAGLSRSTVSKLAGAKDQTLTNKPSQPKPATVIALANELNKDINDALLLAGHAPLTLESEIPNEIRQALKESPHLEGTDFKVLGEIIKLLNDWKAGILNNILDTDGTPDWIEAEKEAEEAIHTTEK